MFQKLFFSFLYFSIDKFLQLAQKIFSNRFFSYCKKKENCFRRALRTQRDKLLLCEIDNFLKRDILIKMKRSWQATLFGKSASKASIYASNPSNDFEKFMKFFEINDVMPQFVIAALFCNNACPNLQ